MAGVSPAALPESGDGRGGAPLAHPCTISWCLGNSSSLRLVLHLLNHSFQGEGLGTCKNDFEISG